MHNSIHSKDTPDGLLLWLPKAHVKAPIIGSIVLTPVLLKLGGYGKLWITAVLNPVTNFVAYLFLILSLWGIIITSSTCLLQTDSNCSCSSHAPLSATRHWLPQPSLSQRYRRVSALLITHGLTPSIVPSSANAHFQRIHSQAMILTRGLQTVFPVIAAWRLLASLTNPALPPAINLIGKLFVVIPIFSWSFLSLFFFHITSSHSLSLFIVTRRGKRTYHVSNLKPSFPRENTVGMEPAWTWEKRFSSPKAKDRLS